MKRFISRGDMVVIKPNIRWNRLPIHAANTNPDIVAGRRQHGVWRGGEEGHQSPTAPATTPIAAFSVPGSGARPTLLGAEVVSSRASITSHGCAWGEVLDDGQSSRPLVEADKVINVPVAKHHNLAKYTGAMKNWYGVLGGRRNRLHQKIDLSIADLAASCASLVVLDAWRVLVRNGPQGGNIDDAKEMHTISLPSSGRGRSFGCTLIGQHRENVAYLAMGEHRGLGTTLFENLR